MGIFVNRRIRAVRADRLGGTINISKQVGRKSSQWECIQCKDTFYIGRKFHLEDIQEGGWPNGTQFKNHVGKVRTITCPVPLPGFDEVPDEG